MLRPHVRKAMHDMRCQRHSGVPVACRDAEVSQRAWGVDGTRPGSCESSIFCLTKAPWHPRSTSPSFGLVAKRLTRCTRHRSRAGAEHGGHVGPGRAGGAPARQDVVFHIKGVGALGRAVYQQTERERERLQCFSQPASLITYRRRRRSNVENIKTV
jgi:hypothetical protein